MHRSIKLAAISLAAFCIAAEMPAPPAPLTDYVTFLGEDLVAKCFPGDLQAILKKKPDQAKKFRRFLSQSILDLPISLADRSVATVKPMSPLALANALLLPDLSDQGRTLTVAAYYTNPELKKGSKPFAVRHQECTNTLAAAVSGSTQGQFPSIGAKLDISMSELQESSKLLTIRTGTFTSTLWPLLKVAASDGPPPNPEQMAALMSLWLAYHEDPKSTAGRVVLRSFDGTAILYEEESSTSTEIGLDQQIEVALGAGPASAQIDQSIRGRYGLERSGQYGEYYTFILGEFDSKPIPTVDEIANAWDRKARHVADASPVVVKLDPDGKGKAALCLPGLPSDPKEAETYIASLDAHAVGMDSESKPEGLTIRLAHESVSGLPTYSRVCLGGEERSVPSIDLEISIDPSYLPQVVLGQYPSASFVSRLQFQGITNSGADGSVRSLSLDYPIRLEASYQEQSEETYLRGETNSPTSPYEWRFALPGNDMNGRTISRWDFKENSSGLKSYEACAHQKALKEGGYAERIVSELSIEKGDPSTDEKHPHYVSVKSNTRYIAPNSQVSDICSLRINLESTISVSPGKKEIVPWTFEVPLDLGEIKAARRSYELTQDLKEVLKQDARTRTGQPLSEFAAALLALDSVSARNDQILQLFDVESVALDRLASKYRIRLDLLR